MKSYALRIQRLLDKFISCLPSLKLTQKFVSELLKPIRPVFQIFRKNNRRASFSQIFEQLQIEGRIYRAHS